MNISPQLVKIISFFKINKKGSFLGSNLQRFKAWKKNNFPQILNFKIWGILFFFGAGRVESKVGGP